MNSGNSRPNQRTFGRDVISDEPRSLTPLRNEDVSGRSAYHRYVEHGTVVTICKRNGSSPPSHLGRGRFGSARDGSTSWCDQQTREPHSLNSLTGSRYALD